jgi:hypothetical protein
MLTSRTNKELSGEWQRQRESALTDSTGVLIEGDYGLDDLNITIEGLGINDPKTYQISTNPVDNLSTSKPFAVDIRQRPDCGD